MSILVSPINSQETAKTRLKKLAETAVIHDVVSPIENSWTDSTLSSPHTPTKGEAGSEPKD